MKHLILSLQKLQLNSNSLLWIWSYLTKEILNGKLNLLCSAIVSESGLQ